MTLPVLPPQGSTSWYAWAQGVHDAAGQVETGRLSDAELKADFVPSSKLTVSATAPASPSVGDVWVDTSS